MPEQNDKPQEQPEIEIQDMDDMPPIGHLMGSISRLTHAQAAVLVLDLGDKMDIGISFHRDYKDREAMILSLRKAADQLEHESSTLDKLQEKVQEFAATKEAEHASKH